MLGIILKKVELLFWQRVNYIVSQMSCNGLTGEQGLISENRQNKISQNFKPEKSYVTLVCRRTETKFQTSMKIL